MKERVYMKDSKKYLISSIILVTIAIVFTMLVKFVDVGAIGPEGSKVGFQAINEFVKNMFPFNETMYKITKYAGFIPLLLAVYYALVAFIQLIKKKSLKKIDKKLILLFSKLRHQRFEVFLYLLVKHLSQNYL